MIERIHLDPKLEKHLAALKKGGRRKSLVADRVEAIIDEVERGRLPSPAICTYTRNGEDRIKGCRKVDLGGGHRLITLKQGADLYLLFVGTHDECGRWVENNRLHFPLEMVTERCRTVNRSLSDAAPSEKPLSPPNRDPDEDWIPPLNDQDLRVVFRGLVGKK